MFPAGGVFLLSSCAADCSEVGSALVPDGVDALWLPHTQSLRPEGVIVAVGLHGEGSVDSV